MKKILAVLGVIVAAAAPLEGALPAYAASSYDDFLQPVTTLNLKSPNGSEELNVTTTVWDYITNALPTASNDCTSDDLQYIIDAPMYYVSQSYSNYNSVLGDAVFMGYSKNTASQLGASFYNDHTGYYLFDNLGAYDPTALGITINLLNNNQVQVRCSRSRPEAMAISTRSGDEFTPKISPFIADLPINYPSGYEGYTIPTWVTEPLHLKPEWTFISSAQWQGRFMDTNVATYDGISELYTVCDNDLAPVIVGNITNGSGWIKEFTISATGQVEVTLPESTNPQTFTITGRYDCGGFGPEFDTDGVYTFDINQYGTVNNAFMENCVDMDLLGQFNPDGLDIPQCIENIQNIIGLLSFGQLKLNKNFENIDSIQCRNLQVIGGWMFKPGAYICPQIPANIRNIITPFILLALGYLAANFLRKRNESI